MDQKAVWKGTTLLSPVPPVLVTTAYGGKFNVMTAAWTGIVNTKPPMLSLSVRPERYTHELMLQSGCFTVNLAPASLVKAVDFCGVRSGRDTDKFSLCSLTAVPLDNMAPLISECPVNLECRITQRVPLGSHDLFLAAIEQVHVDAALVDRSGKLNLDKAALLAYSHGAYYELGRRLGTFGFTVNRKNPAFGNKKRTTPHTMK